MTVDDLAFSLSPAFLAYSGGGLRGGSFAVRRGRVVVRRFSAVRGMWSTGVADRGVLRLPGYGSSSLARIAGATAARGPLARASATRAAAFDAVFRAPLVAKSSRSRLVPSPVR